MTEDARIKTIRDLLEESRLLEDMLDKWQQHPTSNEARIKAAQERLKQVQEELKLCKKE